MREVTLASHALLKGGACCASAVDFTIEKGLNYELGRECVHIGLHDMWRVSSCKAPHDIASCIAHVRADAVSALVDIIDQSLVKDRHELLNALRKQEAATAKLSKAQAGTMP